MKNSILSALAILLITSYFTPTTCIAQAPQGIPYQAIARNASGVAIANTAVKVRFSIRDSIATGPLRYQETHNPTTSALGLFSVNVGMGTVVSGTFSGINWGKNAKFLQVELNTTGGTTYTDLGTTQMMSVPYALYAGQTFINSTITDVGFTMISLEAPVIQNFYTVGQAYDYCFKLIEGGFSDWRLPMLDEIDKYFTIYGNKKENGGSKFRGWTKTNAGGGVNYGYYWGIDGEANPIAIPTLGAIYMPIIQCVR